MMIEQFIARIDEAQRDFPGDTEESLIKGAKKLTKAIKQNSPQGKQKHKNKLKNSWRVQISGSTEGLEAQIYSKAPHFHLVDRGHVIKTPGGSVRGFKQGEHFLQKTLDDKGQEIQQKMGEDLYHRLEDKFR